GAGHAVNILVDRFETHGRVDRHRKERDEEGEQQAGHSSGPEPHDEQGRDGDFWDDLRDHDHRIKAFSNDGRISDQHGDDDAADDAEEEEPDTGQIEGGQKMRKKETTALRHRSKYRRWRRQYDAANAQCSDADLPSQEDERRDEDRPPDGGRVFADVIPHGSPRSP